MRTRRPPPSKPLIRPGAPQGRTRVPVKLPSGPRAQLLMTRILRLVVESGMPDQWAALHLLNIAFHQSQLSKFLDFDFRRVFELIWMGAKKKAGEQDTLDEAIQAWSLTREADFETMAVHLARALVVQATWAKLSREDVHGAVDRFFDAMDKQPPGEGEPEKNG